MTTETEFRAIKSKYYKAVLDLLSDLQWHTNLELGAIGGNRYGARVNELVQDGYKIQVKKIPGGKGSCKYRLKSKIPEAPRSRNVRVYAPPDLVRRAIETRLIPDDLLLILKDSLAKYEANN